MTVRELLCAAESIAPLSLAEPWDNPGLLVGRRDAEVAGPVLLTIDFTEDVLDEALGCGASVVFAYHPPIFHPVKQLSDRDARSRVLLGAIESRMAVYSPHTALDAAPGGVTDWLCRMLAPGDSASLGDTRALMAHTALDRRQSHKLVTFVPETHVDELRNAFASIGAGHIGAYEHCSFSIPGKGAFRSHPDANPVIGKPGVLESVAEIRLEMVCPADALGLAAEMIRRFHPYEEPAWDVYALAPRPDRSAGAGRRITLDQPATPKELAARLKKNLGVDAVKLALASDEPVARVGVCPGAGASLLEPAIGDNCTLFVTGEMRHHEANDAVARGCSVLLAGHTNTERGYLPHYAERLKEVAPELTFVISSADRTLFHTL